MKLTRNIWSPYFWSKASRNLWLSMVLGEGFCGGERDCDKLGFHNWILH